MFGKDFDEFALVDWERSACLCDVGAPGHSLAVAVTDDGRDVLWLIDDAELHAEHPRHGDSRQPHRTGWTAARALARTRRMVSPVPLRPTHQEKATLPDTSGPALAGRCEFHRAARQDPPTVDGTVGAAPLSEGG